MNDSIFFFFYSLAHRNAFLDSAIIFVADTLPYIVIMGAGLFVLFHHDIFKQGNMFLILKQKYEELSIVFFSGLIAWISAHLFKLLFSMPRPFESLEGVTALFEQSGNGFPSGHSAFFMALAFSIFFVHKKAGYVFILLALIIGAARIAAGVHFPLDILGGFLLGYLIAYFMKNV